MRKHPEYLICLLNSGSERRIMGNKYFPHTCITPARGRGGVPGTIVGFITKADQRIMVTQFVPKNASGILNLKIEIYYETNR